MNFYYHIYCIAAHQITRKFNNFNTKWVACADLVIIKSQL